MDKEFTFGVTILQERPSKVENTSWAEISLKGVCPYRKTGRLIP
jgi:hypothetical protein